MFTYPVHPSSPIIWLRYSYLCLLLQFLIFILLFHTRFSIPGCLSIILNSLVLPWIRFWHKFLSFAIRFKSTSFETFSTYLTSIIHLSHQISKVSIFAFVLSIFHFRSHTPYKYVQTDLLMKRDDGKRASTFLLTFERNVERNPFRGRAGAGQIGC